MKIIDAHAHICKYINGIGSKGELVGIGNGEAMYASGDKVRMFPIGSYDYSFTPEDAIKIMKENNVCKAVLLQGNYLGFQNLYTIEAKKKYPDIFNIACTYDIFCRNKQAIIKNLFIDNNVKIIKMEVSNSSGLMCNHDTVLLNGKEMQEVYQMALDNHLTFVIDIGRPNNDCYQIDNLLEMVKKYKDLTFVICHLMAHQINDEALLLTNLPKFKLPNVYFDLASVNNNVKPEGYPYPTATKYIRHACDIVGSDHLMWGSDMPCGVTKDTYYNNIHYILDSNLLTDKEKENIFYNTANKIYFK